MPIRVFDYFSGCGGTSAGFQQAGMEIMFALDIDPDAAATYRKNFPKTEFCEEDITKVNTNKIHNLIKSCGDDPILFCGCAPCQPFTRQNTESPKDDKRKNLLSNFGNIVEEFKPDFVFVENVPGLQKVPKDKKGPFPAFKKLLKKMGYHITYGVVAAQDYGAPQLRRRFVLLASKHSEIKIPAPTHGKDLKNDYKTVRRAIEGLPAIAAGETYKCNKLKNHRAAALSELNLKRIKASDHNGGGRLNWDKKLWPKCYTRKNKNGEVHSGHTDCYGRLWWDKPATGLTTRCISYSNGRFGHPEQNRAISVREAARLQGFDDDFEFKGNLNSMAKQIGNAVPVDLACAMGNQFIKQIEALNG